MATTPRGKRPATKRPPSTKKPRPPAQPPKPPAAPATPAPATEPSTAGLTRGGLPPWLTPGNPGNSGGKPGRSGRKPDVYRALCRTLLEEPTALQAVRQGLADPTNPGYASLYKTIASYAHGRPDVTVNVRKEKHVIVFDMPARAGALGDGNVDDVALDDASRITALAAQIEAAGDDPDEEDA